jgi:hypothetical protein
VALETTRQVELKQDNMDLPRVQPRGADQFVDIYGTWA